MLYHAFRLQPNSKIPKLLQVHQEVDRRDSCGIRSGLLYLLHRVCHRQVWIVSVLLFSKKPLFSNELQNNDKASKITARLLFGLILVGLGFGLGGLCFESFLLTVPSSSLRIIIFWGLPYIFSMKAALVISERSQLPVEPKSE